MRRAWLFRQCWDVHILQLFFVTNSFCGYALWEALLLFYTVIDNDVMVSARGCLGSTCISLVWLERCKLSLSPGMQSIYRSIYLSIYAAIYMAA